MAATLFDNEAVVSQPALRCPLCAGPVTEDLACWHCCERLCRYCRQPTGTAFIGVCWACWFLETGGSESD